ncbi:hypothetical protein AgCh_023375 [Apium graveolens]
MAGLCFSGMCISRIYSLVCTDFVLFVSFVFCHPLYLSYFVFFSPYLLKLMSFLSPLFVTVSLIASVLIYDNFTPKLSEPGCSFLLSAFSAVLDILSSKFAEGFEDFEEFEVYKIVFLLNETSTFAEEFEPECEEKYCLEDVDQVLTLSSGFKTRSSMYQLAQTTEEDVLKLRIGSEATDINIDCCDNGKEQTGSVKLCVDSHDKIGPEATDINIDSCDNGKECTESVKLCVDLHDKIVKCDVKKGLHALNFDNEESNLGNYRSMRKDKEWKRTLACKLYDERHYNVMEGNEGMDSLWETYESDSPKSISARKDNKRRSLKKKSSDLEDEDDDEVEMTNGHLCCLQAFKFSARKMNMGMGRTNIVRITKALKGIGWLHHVKKHDKKEKS